MRTSGLIPLLEQFLEKIGLSSQCRDIDQIMASVSSLDSMSALNLTRESWEQLLGSQALNAYDLVTLSAILNLADVTDEPLSLEKISLLQSQQFWK